MTISLSPVLNCSGHFDSVLRARFSRDGRRIASVGADGQLRIVDLETVQCIHSAALHSGCIHDLSWDGSGKFIYTVGSEGDVVCSAVSCLPSETPQQPRQPQDKEIRGVVGRFPHAKETSTQDNKPTTCMNRFATAVTAPGHRGQYFVTGGFDSILRQWDIRQLGCVCDVRSHDAPISSLEHSYDDTLVVSSSLDGFARLWDSTGLSLVRTFLGVNGIPLAHALFSPKCDQLLCIPLESECRLWNILQPHLFQTLQTVDPLTLTHQPSLHPPTPTLNKPFVNQTAAEFLTSPGSFVFGTFSSDGQFVMVPKTPSTPFNSTSSAFGLSVWSTSSGKFLKLFSNECHQGSSITSVSCSPCVVQNDKTAVLVTTCGDYPNNSVVVWCGVSSQKEEEQQRLGENSVDTTIP